MLDMAQYFRDVSEYHREHPEQRIGQAYMNVLWFTDSELHAEVYGTTNDCFYQDERVHDFLGFLAERVYRCPDHGNWPTMARSVWPDGEQV